MLPITIALAMLVAPTPARDEPVTPGTVTIEQPDGDLPAATKRVFADAVANALAQAEFVPLPSPGKGRYVAYLRVTRTQRGLVASRATASGPSTALGNWGGGVAVTLPTKNTQLRPLIVTELQIRLVRRDSQRAVWASQALTAQAEGSADDAPAAVADKLAETIVRRFPESSTETIAVP